MSSSNNNDKSLAEALAEIKLAFENFCADADAIIEDAKQRRSNGRNKGGR